MKKEKEKKKKREKKEKMPGELELRIGKEPEKAPGVDEVPLQYVAENLGGKWKFRILWALREGAPKRYGEIKAKVADITDMMLSQSLRELGASGLVERAQYEVIPPRVEYRITDSGRELIPALEMLRAWAEKTKKG